MKKLLISILALFAVAVLTWSVMPNGPIGKYFAKAIKERRQEFKAVYAGATPGPGAVWSSDFTISSRTGKPRTFRWWLELYNRKGLVAKPYEGRFQADFPKGSSGLDISFEINEDVSSVWTIEAGKRKQYKTTYIHPFGLDAWVGSSGGAMELNEHYILGMGFKGPKGAFVPQAGFEVTADTVLKAAKENEWVYVLRGKFEE